jgi:hypothetical protein
MDGNLSAVVHTAKQLALLAEALERRSETAVSTQRSAAFALTRSAAEAKEAVDTLTFTAHRDVESATRGAVEDILGRGLSAFHHQVVLSSEKVADSSGLIYAAGEMVRSVMVRQIKLAYLAVAGAIALVVLGGGALIWVELSAYKDARARSAAAKINAEVVEAYSRVGMTSCGGHPCVKLDRKAKRWGDKGQYVLIDVPGGGR